MSDIQINNKVVLIPISNIKPYADNSKNHPETQIKILVKSIEQFGFNVPLVLDENNSVRIFRHLWNGLIKASEQGQKRVHPTQKPTALAAHCFEKYTMGNNILDLFGGSGSTMVACERVSV